MTLTKLENLVPKVVFGDAVASELMENIRFAPFAKVDNTLELEGAQTLKRLVRKYSGPAKDKEEGVPVDADQLSAETVDVDVKVVQKVNNITDEAIRWNQDDTLEHSYQDLAKGIADKLESDYLDVLKTATLTTEVENNAEGILDGLVVFEDEDIEDYVLFVHPKDYAKLTASLFATPAGAVQQTAIAEGRLAELVGVSNIVRSRKVEEGTAFLQKLGAVEIVYGFKPEVEYDRFGNDGRTEVIIRQAYAVHLFNDNGVVQLTFTEPAEA